MPRSYTSTHIGQHEQPWVTVNAEATVLHFDSSISALFFESPQHAHGWLAAALRSAATHIEPWMVGEKPAGALEAGDRLGYDETPPTATPPLIVDYSTIIGDTVFVWCNDQAGERWTLERCRTELVEVEAPEVSS